MLRAVEYSFERSIKPEQLQVLLRQTGWAKDRNSEQIHTMLEGTAVILGVWEDDHLVGFARAISDGIYRALIDDVVVEESKRGMGIGSELMQRLVERLTEIGIQQVLLRCREDTVPFYERHGFEMAHGATMNLSKS